MKSVVLGRGCLGEEYERHGYDVWGRDRFEIEDANTLRYDDALFDYDVIINCIGKSDTRWCERPENWEETLLVNGILPSRLAALCEQHGKKFVHISTGCLYDRNDYPQTEADFTVSHCRYTVAKWVGENGLNPERDLILRPRLFFNDQDHPKNLLRKLPRFTSYLDELNSFTHTSEVVRATSALVAADCAGVYNVACEGFLTVFDLAQLVGLRGGKIHADTLHLREGLYLVNNILNLDKLKRHYEPANLVDSVLKANAALNGAAHA